MNNEPTIIGKIREISQHLATAEMRVAAFRGDVWGEGEDSGSAKIQTTLSGMITDISARLASLCGDLATINQRFGCTPEPGDPGPLVGVIYASPAVPRQTGYITTGSSYTDLSDVKQFQSSPKEE